MILQSLYLSIQELQQMHSDGFSGAMATHRFLNTFSKHEQQIEIVESFAELEKLSLLNSNKEPKVMCYPFGAYNAETIDILFDQKVDYSLTTKLGASKNELNPKDIHELKRWDTNDFWDNQWRKPTLPF